MFIYFLFFLLFFPFSYDLRWILERSRVLKFARAGLSLFTLLHLAPIRLTQIEASEKQPRPEVKEFRRSAGFAACFLKAEVEFTQFQFGGTRPMNAAFILE